ncbi:hypothetical protein BGX31_004645, partial [Mortierella sp. GBA43]
DEDYLNDEVIRITLQLLQHEYGDRFLFIPTLGFENWRQSMKLSSQNWFEWTFGHEKIAQRKVSKAFNLVHMDGHWGAET